MKPHVCRLMTAFALVTLMTLLPLYAQGRAPSSISGIVVDPSGGVIPGASVKAKNNGTGFESDTVTTEAGTFTIPALPPGSYSVTVTLQGFKTVELKNVTLNVATLVNLRIAMEVGALEEAVVVGGESRRPSMPSIVCTVAVTGNTLGIIGDAGNNNVAIVDNGAAGIVVVCDGVAFPAAIGIERVLVDTGAGDDTVTYSRSAAGGNFTGPLDFRANLGDGTDSFIANFNGNDVVGIARVEFDIKGQAGDDRITFPAGTAAAPVDIASQAAAYLRARGGDGTDLVTMSYFGKLDGSLNLQARGGDGKDIVAATVGLSAGSAGSLEGDVKGGDDDDNLTLNITGAGATVAAIDALLDGGGGTDTCFATSNVTVKNCEF